MAASLARALKKLREHPVGRGAVVELICVDGRLWYDDTRHEAWTSQTERLLTADGPLVCTRHVPPKPSAWQGPNRITQRDHFDLNNARNTGIAYASYDHVVLFDDNSLVHEDFLVEHCRAAERGIALCGTYVTYNTAEIEDGVVVSGERHTSQDTRGGQLSRAHGGWAYGLNFSFPLYYAIVCNGYDEKYSGQGGSEDCDFGVRLERAGCKSVYNPDCFVYQILESHTSVLGWGEVDKTLGVMKERVLSDGIPHFANEWLIEELVRDPRRHTPLGNDFFMKDLIDAAKGKKPWPTKRAVTHDWRDNQPLKDM